MLTNLGKKITDFDLDPTSSKIESGNDKGDIDETYGINVQFQGGSLIACSIRLICANFMANFRTIS